MGTCLLEYADLPSAMWHFKISPRAQYEILSECQTGSVESQLRSKRPRWYGHVCRMPDTRVRKKVLYGQRPR